MQERSTRRPGGWWTTASRALALLVLVGCATPPSPTIPAAPRAIVISERESGRSGRLPLAEWNYVIRTLQDCRWERGWFTVLEPELTIGIEHASGRTLSLHLMGSDVMGDAAAGYPRCRLAEARARAFRDACLRALR